MTTFQADAFQADAFQSSGAGEGETQYQTPTLVPGAHGRKRREFQSFLDDLAKEEARAPEPVAVEPAPEPEEPVAPEPAPIVTPRVRRERAPLPPPKLEALDALLLAAGEQARARIRAQREAEEALRRALEEDEEDVLMLLAA